VDSIIAQIVKVLLQGKDKKFIAMTEKVIPIIVK